MAYILISVYNYMCKIMNTSGKKMRSFLNVRKKCHFCLIQCLIILSSDCKFLKSKSSFPTAYFCSQVCLTLLEMFSHLTLLSQSSNLLVLVLK